LPDPTKSSVDVDPVAWIREHWALVGGIVLVILVVWAVSGEPRHEAGRYTLVKDDVPCQSAGDASNRRWCYVVLDTRTGKLEERVRKIGGRNAD
jgi:hypothetical protein